MKLPQSDPATESGPLSVEWLVVEGRNHWRLWLPKRYKALFQAGILEGALMEAATRTLSDIKQFEGFMTAWELWPEVRERYLILPPE